MRPKIWSVRSENFFGAKSQSPPTPVLKKNKKERRRFEKDYEKRKLRKRLYCRKSADEVGGQPKCGLFG